MTPVTVVILDSTNAVDEVRLVDHDLSSDRQWMGKSAYWAFRNNYNMLTFWG